MKGLLLKDCYTLAKQVKMFLLLIVVFACLPGFSVSALAVMYAAMLPITALAYDERSKWDHLAVMMPYSVTSIVWSKYVLGYLAIAVAAVLSVAAQCVLAVVKGGGVDMEAIGSTGLVLCMAVIIKAINLPVMFKMGVEKGRLLFFVLVAVVVVAGMLVSGGAAERLPDLDAQMPVILLAALVATVLLNAISVKLSCVWYRRREC